MHEIDSLIANIATDTPTSTLDHSFTSTTYDHDDADDGDEGVRVPDHMLMFTTAQQQYIITLEKYGVWYGMVWYGMVWYGMVWYGMVWYSTTLSFYPLYSDLLSRLALPGVYVRPNPSSPFGLRREQKHRKHWMPHQII